MTPIKNAEFVENAFLILTQLCHNPKALEITPFALVQSSFSIAKEFMDAEEDIHVQSGDRYV